jgi:hypothetical protein
LELSTKTGKFDGAPNIEKLDAGLKLHFHCDFTTMAGTNEPSPLSTLISTKLQTLTMATAPMPWFLSNNCDLSDFGTPPNTFDAPKNPNILHDGEVAAATAAEPKTLRVPFTD